MSCHILTGDCFEHMQRFPDACVNLVLCDLPYGVTRNKWDNILPFEDLWCEWKRLLVPNGMVILTSAGLFTAHVILSNPNWFKYKCVWVKSKATNFLNAKKQPLRKHEDILVFCEGAGCYHPQMTSGKPYDRGVVRAFEESNYRSMPSSHRKNTSGDRYPVDVLYIPTAESEGAVIHPTQKPVRLGKWLIRTYTNPGDTVLDCCCGSGGFVIAAALEGRHAIGMEIDSEMAEKARNRAAGLLGE